AENTRETHFLLRRPRPPGGAERRLGAAAGAGEMRSGWWSRGPGADAPGALRPPPSGAQTPSRIASQSGEADPLTRRGRGPTCGGPLNFSVGTHTIGSYSPWTKPRSPDTSPTHLPASMSSGRTPAATPQRSPGATHSLSTTLIATLSRSADSRL